MMASAHTKRDIQINCHPERSLGGEGPAFPHLQRLNRRTVHAKLKLSGYPERSIDSTVQHRRDLLHFFRQRGEFGGEDRLNAVGQRRFRVVVNLDE
jgi:hypothetical protein